MHYGNWEVYSSLQNSLARWWPWSGNNKSLHSPIVCGWGTIRVYTALLFLATRYFKATAPLCFYVWQLFSKLLYSVFQVGCRVRNKQCLYKQNATSLRKSCTCIHLVVNLYSLCEWNGFCIFRHCLFLMDNQPEIHSREPVLRYVTIWMWF